MASSGKDSFTPYEELLAAPLTDPWTHNTGEPPCYAPDYDLLGRLLTIPVAAGAMSESGSFANGIDAWIAQELRGAGFGADEVWPRPPLAFCPATLLCCSTSSPPRSAPISPAGSPTWRPSRRSTPVCSVAPTRSRSTSSSPVGTVAPRS